MANNPSDVQARVESHCVAGESLVDAKQHAAAVEKFQAAWELLPDPKEEQDPAIHLLGAIADCKFVLRDWEGCCRAVQSAFRCGADVGNPFLRMRLGQSLYEMGNEKEVANWLVPVYLTEGRAPFRGEDPKYLEFFRSKLNPPVGGWPEGC